MRFFLAKVEVEKLRRTGLKASIEITLTESKFHFTLAEGIEVNVQSATILMAVPYVIEKRRSGTCRKAEETMFS